MTKQKRQNTKVAAKGPDPMFFFSATKVLNSLSSIPEQRGKQIHTWAEALSSRSYVDKWWECSTWAVAIINSPKEI